MDQKKDTLYFSFKVNVGNLSPAKVAEAMQSIRAMIAPKADDQYAEKWFLLPVKDENTAIELLYPPSDDAKRRLETRYEEFAKAGWNSTKLGEFRLSKDELTRRYLSKVNQIATDIEWKTTFGPVEICELIYEIMETAKVRHAEGWYPVIYCGVENGNGRRYEIDEVEKQMDDLSEITTSGRMYGQVGYPYNPLTNNIEDVMLRNVSHAVTDVLLSDGILWAKIKVLDTDNGRALQQMLDEEIVVFRPVVAGGVETIGQYNYAKIERFLGIHAINASEDSFSKITNTYDAENTGG